MARVLDKGGILLAFIMGILIAIFGGLEYLALMLFFFVLAMLVTRYEHETKRDMGIYEHERGWENVLSNGLLPTILAIASSFLGPIPYIACVAAVTADKFGSELGVLDRGKPISLENLKPVKPGVSGAVTVMGTVASLAGATVIGLGAFFIFDINATAALLIGLAGLAGSIVDSIFGIFEEKGWGTKGTTNFVCSITGAVLAFIFIK